MQQGLDKFVRALAFDGTKDFIRAACGVFLMTVLVPMTLSTWDLLKGGSVHEALNVGLATFVLMWVLIILVCVTVVVSYRVWLAAKKLHPATSSETYQPNAPARLGDAEILVGSWLLESRNGDYIGIWMFRLDRTVTGRTWLRDPNNHNLWMYDHAEGTWELTDIRAAIQWKSLQPNGQPCHDELLRPINPTGTRGDGWGIDCKDCWRAVKLHAADTVQHPVG